jgi:hypothetical protein
MIYFVGYTCGLVCRITSPITSHEICKAVFLWKLVNLAKDNPHPTLIGGNFNFLRF